MICTNWGDCISLVPGYAARCKTSGRTAWIDADDHHGGGVWLPCCDERHSPAQLETGSPLDDDMVYALARLGLAVYLAEGGGGAISKAIETVRQLVMDGSDL